jgi:uncharacterized protein
MTRCLFVSDLHGDSVRYEKLFAAVLSRRPAALFIGGDILPSALLAAAGLSFCHNDFINGFVVPRLTELKRILGDAYPRVFVILGNDDGRFEEAAMLDVAASGLWSYVHGTNHSLAGHTVYGYSYIPPSPFLLKDFERYDVSRYVDPGSVSPEEGRLTVPVAAHVRKWSTIKADLEILVGGDDLGRGVFLFHCPPYRTALDRAALDGKTYEGVALDVNIGSIAIARFIEERQPHLTLHGHVHESCRLTGVWKERRGRTWMFNAAHDGPELSLVQFDLERPSSATRELL